MVDSREQKNDLLFVVFFAHFILSTWAIQGMWMPISYLFYNGILLFTMLWCIHNRESEEAPFMALCIDMVSVILDIISLSIFWPITWDGVGRFSATSAVLNLLARPASGFVLYRVVQSRSETYGNFALPGGLGALFGGSHHSPYEDIDHPTQQVPPAAPGVSSPTASKQTSPDSLFTT